ncbi:MAG: primosomal protein N', partial [Betaproteobacteria bacterium]
MSHCVSVVVQTPAHSDIAGPLCYQSEFSLTPGTLVRVPLGKRETLGVVWDAGEGDAARGGNVALRPVSGVLIGIAPLSANWRRLVGFAAGYYQRSLGEVALAALPPQLRDLSPLQVGRRLQRATTGAAG